MEITLSQFTEKAQAEEFKTKKLSPFDFVGAINDTKNNLIIDEDTEKMYVPFIVNRQLSYFHDTVMLANEMNRYAGIDNRLQFDFLRMATPRRKRFSKWGKVDESKILDAIIELYTCSMEKARMHNALLNDEQRNILIAKVSHGGRHR